MEDDLKEPVTPPTGLLLVPVQGDSISPVVLPGQYVAIDQEWGGFEVDGEIVVAYIEEPSGEDERRESMTGTFVKRYYRGTGYCISPRSMTIFRSARGKIIAAYGQ